MEIKDVKITNSVPILMLFGAALFWSTTFIFSKILINEISLGSILLYRTIATCFILSVVCFKTLKKELIAALHDSELLIFSIIGTFALITQTYALKYTTASTTAFISCFYVILVPLLKYIHYKVKFSKKFYLAIILAIFGTYLISFGVDYPKQLNFGEILAFISAIFYAYYVISLEHVASKNKFSSSTIINYYFFVVLVTSFFICLFSDNFCARKLLNIHITSDIILLAIIGGAVPYVLMAEGQRYVSAHIASLIYNFESVFAGILSFLFLGESFSLIKIIGCLLVFIAIALGTITRYL